MTPDSPSEDPVVKQGKEIFSLIVGLLSKHADKGKVKQGMALVAASLLALA